MKALKDYTVRVDANSTLEEATSELAREIDVRRRLYDRWISEGRLSRVDAHDRLCRMLTALRYLINATEETPAAGTVPTPEIEHTEKVLDSAELDA
jgi:hypothetical protein